MTLSECGRSIVGGDFQRSSRSAVRCDVFEGVVSVGLVTIIEGRSCHTNKLIRN